MCKPRVFLHDNPSPFSTPIIPPRPSRPNTSLTRAACDRECNGYKHCQLRVSKTSLVRAPALARAALLAVAAQVDRLKNARLTMTRRKSDNAVAKSRHAALEAGNNAPRAAFAPAAHALATSVALRTPLVRIAIHFQVRSAAGQVQM